MQAGIFKPGSLSDRVLCTIRAAREPVPRSVLIASVTGKERGWFNRILDRLIVQGLVRESCAGFLPAEAPRGHVPDHLVETLPVVPDAMRPWLAAIIRRAHAYRRARTPSLGVRLLKEAALRIDLPHVRADLLALAALFAEHRQTYPSLGPARRVA